MCDIIFLFFDFFCIFAVFWTYICVMGVLRGAFFIVGGAIGAGFVSGAELVRFFPSEKFFWAALLSSALFALCCALLLKTGKRHGGYAGVLKALFKRGAPVANALFLLCALVPSAGMLAGLDALLPTYKPLFSVLGLALSCLFLGRGMKGVSLLNALLVPVLLGFVFFAARGEKNLLSFSFFLPWRGFAGGVVYAGLNMFLIAPVLMDAGVQMKRPALSAFLAGVLVLGAACCILGKIYGGGGAALHAEMPFLFVMQGKKVFSVAVALAILTSLVSSLYPLMAACGRLSGKKKYAAEGFTLLAAFVLSRLGLGGIVSYLYPVLGFFGLTLSVLCVFHDYLFKQHHKKVHSRRKQAQKEGGAHHEVELEHLPAVHDEVAQPRAGNDILAHDRADPRHAHVHLQHRNE